MQNESDLKAIKLKMLKLNHLVRRGREGHEEWMKDAVVIMQAFYGATDLLFDLWNGKNNGPMYVDAKKNQALTAKRLRALAKAYCQEYSVSDVGAFITIVDVHHSIKGLAVQVKTGSLEDFNDYSGDLASLIDSQDGDICYFHSLNIDTFERIQGCDLSSDEERKNAIRMLHLNARHDIRQIKLKNKFRQVQIDDMLASFKIGDVMGVLTVPSTCSPLNIECNPKEFYQIVVRPDSIRKPRKNKVVLKRINTKEKGGKHLPILNSFYDDEYINIKINAPEIDPTYEFIDCNIRFLRCKVSDQRRTHAYLMRPDENGDYKLVHKRYEPSIDVMLCHKGKR